MRQVLRACAAGIAVLLAAFSTWLVAAPTATAATVTALHDGTIELRVVQLTPTSPRATPQANQLTVLLELTNTTNASFHKVTVTGVRGNPISTQSALDATLAKPGRPDPAQAADISTPHPVTAALGPHATTTLSFVTTTSTSTQNSGLCLCQNRIYPLYFEVHYTPKGGSDTVLGTAQTYLPSFGEYQPHPVQVSWVWPILDRPHRGASSTVFTDDDLAGSVAGGRLDHLLQTVEQVLAGDPTISMTLLVDPEILDELSVMQSGKYQVDQNGRMVAGTGATAAKNWLDRLRAVLSEDQNLQLAFTPYADPDVRSLAADGLGWAQQPDAAAQARIEQVVGGRSADTDISWPAGSSLDGQTLSALIRSGVRTVIVSDQTVSGGSQLSPPPPALAPLTTDAGTADAAITSAGIESYVDQVVTGTDLSGLPQLVAQVAIRAVEDGAHSHYVVLVPARTVDPNPQTASSAILATAHTDWSRSLSLADAAQRVTPVRQGALHEQPESTPLPEPTIAAAHYLAAKLSTAQSLLVDGGQPAQPATTGLDPAALVAGLASGLQRSESVEWGSDTSAGAELAGSLASTVRTYVTGVHLIRPTQGTYTLGSSNSPLPLTIENTLAVPVFVRLQVSAVGGLPGFSADDLGVQPVAARSKLALRIPVHVDRAGRIKVQVELMTPLGDPLGESLQLSVRSTALGNIGKIITAAAAAVLAAALLVRALRQLRRRRRGSPQDAPDAAQVGS